jgi:hypothetical protein
MRFVDDAKRAYRWFSVHAMVWSAALLGAWEVIPPDLKAGLSDRHVRWAAVALLVLGVAGRVVKQGKP